MNCTSLSIVATRLIPMTPAKFHANKNKIPAEASAGPVWDAPIVQIALFFSYAICQLARPPSQVRHG
jgi:hypothetical protein